MARSLGGKIVRVFSGYSPEPADYQADWNRCVTALRDAADAAGQFGITLGLQNHHDIGVSVEGFIELLDDVNHPNLKAMFDPWSIALQSADLYQAARLLAPRMVQTTLADYVRTDRFGFIDLPAFFAGLKEGGFDGLVAYEMCSPLRGGGSEANLDAAATKSLAEIRRLIGD
jgi:sugar phosphate isomerase/epimerase